MCSNRKDFCGAPTLTVCSCWCPTYAWSPLTAAIEYAAGPPACTYATNAANKINCLCKRTQGPPDRSKTRSTCKWKHTHKKNIKYWGESGKIAMARIYYIRMTRRERELEKGRKNVQEMGPAIKWTKAIWWGLIRRLDPQQRKSRTNYAMHRQFYIFSLQIKC